MGEPSSHHALGRELVRLGLVDELAPATERSLARSPSRLRSISLLQPLAGLVLAAGLIVVGGGAMAYLSRAEPASAQSGQRQPLVPDKAGYLKVVAEPWAQVFVDGQHVDTTPFARAVPLAAGVHYVRLEHPDAPSERRTVRLARGETVLLDVKMQVPLEPSSGSPAAASASAAASAAPVADAGPPP
jgi:serine/threonine-protein kinase